jgi:hypothetical protein
MPLASPTGQWQPFGASSRRVTGTQSGGGAGVSGRLITFPSLGALGSALNLSHQTAPVFGLAGEKRARSSGGRAADFYSAGLGFEPRRAHQDHAGARELFRFDHLTAPSVRPRTRWRCTNSAKITIGNAPTTPAAVAHFGGCLGVALQRARCVTSADRSPSLSVTRSVSKSTACRLAVRKDGGALHRRQVRLGMAVDGVAAKLN